jgi:hypothetical protein
MEGIGQCCERKPLYRIKFIRLAILHFAFVNQDFKVERDPMCFLSIVFAMHVSVSEKFVGQHIGTIFFKDFLFECMFD